MNKSEFRRQGDLFQKNEFLKHSYDLPKEFSISNKSIKAWQEKIASHQSTIFDRESASERQFSLFKTSDSSSADHFDPLKLTPFPLCFWRWPESPHHGQAIYLVMDRPEHIQTPLLLYVGETQEGPLHLKYACSYTIHVYPLTDYKQQAIES